MPLTRMAPEFEEELKVRGVMLSARAALSRALPASLVELAENVDHLSPESSELVAVENREPFEYVEPVVGQREFLAPVVRIGGLALDEPSFAGPIDEFDGGMVLELERFGDLGDDRRAFPTMAPDRQEELVVRGSYAGLSSGLLGGSNEQAQRVPEPPERCVVLVRQRSSRILPIHIVSR